MEFCSVFFLFRFLPIFLLIYYLVPQKGKNAVLLLGSLSFFACGDAVCLGAMLVSLVMDYIYGRLYEWKLSKTLNYFLVGLSFVTNLTAFLLFSFVFPRAHGKTGFSAYMLLSFSYVMLVFLKRVKVQRSIIDFGVYTCFFPLLAAGMLVDYEKFTQELKERKIDISLVQSGIKRFIYGLAKKVVLAGQMGKLCQEIQQISPAYLTVGHAWVGVISLTAVIYFTLSGYADMAIGIGRMLGFHLQENFNFPIMADSVTQFWNRFCITITTWFRENIYQRICYKKETFGGFLLGTLLMWLGIGIWFGRGLAGVLCGLWFALFIILERIFLEKLFRFFPSFIRGLYTHVVVMLGWVILSRNHLSGTVEQMKYLVGTAGNEIFDYSVLYLLGKYSVFIILSFFAALPTYHRLERKMKMATTGAGMGVYRVISKLIPAVLFLVSMIYLVP